ncbi:MAG: hypothetical protein FWD13_07455 [Treponema sp.]|nr:hypothetical protein [Treponema sp.]
MFVIALTILSVFAVELNAAPVNGDSFHFRQPDGSLVPVRVWGDEFYQDVESVDGYTLIRGSDGWIYYAELSSDGNEYVPTAAKYTGASRVPGARKGLRINEESVIEKQRRAREESGYYELVKPRQRKAMPVQHSMTLNANGISSASTERVVGLTVLVDFHDQEEEDTSATKARVENLLNNRGGVSGQVSSVFDYFYNVSNGLMEYTNIVIPFIRLDKSKAYYEASSSSTLPELCQDVVEKLNEIDFDLSGVTTDIDEKGRNVIRVFNILYAGNSRQGWAGGLWPGMFTGDYELGDFIVGRFQVTDLGSDDGTPLSLSTVIHETAHLLMGWEDLYPYDPHQWTNYVNSWCIMSSKGLMRPNPYFLLKAGWIDTVHITDAPVGAEFSHTSNTPFAYVFMRDTMDNPNSSDKEFYMIEARRRTNINEDRHNSYIHPLQSGLQIWHIHTGGDNTHVYSFPLVAYRGTFYESFYDTRTKEPYKYFHRNHHGTPAQYHKYATNGTYNGAYSKIHLTEISDTGTAVMTFKIGEPVFVSVRNITLPLLAVPTGTYTLNGTISPSDANDREIIWEVVDAGVTNAVVTGNTLTTTSEGTITLRATILNGIAIDSAYIKSFTVEVYNKPHYVITGSGAQFTATKNETLFVSEQPISTVMQRIRDDLNGRECSIWFGNGEVLDIGVETIRLNNRGQSNVKVIGYSKIALSGKITSANTRSTIILGDEIFITSEADVKNSSATGSAFETLDTFAEVLTIRGGEITSATTTASRGTIYNYSPGTVEVVGGIISNTISYGNAIYSANTDGSLVLGGSCNIIGQISGFAAGKVSVSSVFNPGSNMYTLNPAEGSRVHGALSVIGGAAYANNFELNSREFTFAVNGRDLTLSSVPNFVPSTYYIVSGNMKIPNPGPVYNFTGFDASVRQTISVPPSGITVKIINPDYLHGAMVTVRNKGHNDSVVVEWFGVRDQNHTDNMDRTANLFGNGAQINNIATPRINGVISLDLRSATDKTYSVDIEIYNWRNGRGYVAPVVGDSLKNKDLFTALRKDNSVIGLPDQPIQTVIDVIKLYGSGEEYSVHFGNGTDFLDIDSANITLSGSEWQRVTLLGQLTSRSNTSTITLRDTAHVKNEAHIQNTSFGPVFSNSTAGTLLISGGTISGAFAITNDNTSGSLVLSGTPNIAGLITGFGAGNISVVTGNNTMFNPGSRKYVLNPAASARAEGTLSVVNGAGYLNNFELYSGPLTLVRSGSDLVISKISDFDSIAYVITGGNGSFTAAVASDNHVIAANMPIRNVITSINNHAGGTNCFIQFGNGSLLDIGTENIEFSTSWGKVTLSGRLTSASQRSTISISTNTLSENRADIRNTSSGSAIAKSGNDTLTVSGGTVHAYTGNAISNSGNGALIVSGGTVHADSGYGIYNLNSRAGNPWVTINGTAHITSANNSNTGGTIYNNGNLKIVGGRISNTVSGANAVYRERGSFTLGGSPDIIGLISSDTTIEIDTVVGFNPANRRYVLNPLNSRDSIVVVTNGASYINNFNLSDSNHLLVIVANDLVRYFNELITPFSLGKKAVAYAPVIDMESPDAEPIGSRRRTATAMKLTVGPNPTANTVGSAKFFWEGKAIKGTTLSIYDVSGNIVTRVRISDNGNNNAAKRVVGLWNLTDSKGRAVANGNYVVKGRIVTKDGERKNISIVIGVN